MLAENGKGDVRVVQVWRGRGRFSYSLVVMNLHFVLPLVRYF